MVLINENNKAENMIKSGNIGKSVYKSIYLLCKYWHNKGMNKIQIRQEIHSFLHDNYKHYNKVKMLDKIDEIINSVKKHSKPMIEIEKIDFTTSELKIIDSLHKDNLKRLAFIILFYAKLTKQKYNVQKDIWLNDGISKYCNLAKVYGKKKDKVLLMSELNDTGLITISESLKEFMYKINYIKEGDIAFSIYNLIDDKELVNYYLRYVGENVIECSECRKLIKLKSNRQQYCNQCWKEREKEQTRKRVEKYRKNT